jgi:hypothetical protein
MRNDSLAEATLVSYKQRKSAFCDASAVKAVKEVKTIAVVEAEQQKVAVVKPENKIVGTSKENARLCNVFTQKVKRYESNMRDDSLAEATLASYKKRMSSFCDTSSTRSHS